MFRRYLTSILGVAIMVGVLGGCEEKKRTHKITMEGPEKKTELKWETTEKKKDTEKKE